MADHDFIEGWVQHILDNRADKSWTPRLFGHKDVADYLKSVAGLTVEVDESLPPLVLELRCADNERLPPEKNYGRPDDGVRGRYQGIAVPPAPLDVRGDWHKSQASKNETDEGVS